MTIIKGRLRPEGTNNYADVVHLETSADQIVETTDKKVMTAAERTKLNGIEAGATKDMTAAEILTLLKTVDTDTSGLNANTLQGRAVGDLIIIDEESITTKPRGLTPTWGGPGGKVYLNTTSWALLDVAQITKTDRGMLDLHLAITLYIDGHNSSGSWATDYSYGKITVNGAVALEKQSVVPNSADITLFMSATLDISNDPVGTVYNIEYLAKQHSTASSGYVNSIGSALFHTNYRYPYFII